jgi:ABC-type cobalamin transport system ATPase subunit
MTTQQAAILSIKGLTKSYDGKPVLKSLSLDLFPGMVVGLLGLNGAGKTTLMHCALGILAIDGGEVSILGDCATNLSIETKAKVGFVSQQPFGCVSFLGTGLFALPVALVLGLSLEGEKALQVAALMLNMGIISVSCAIAWQGVRLQATEWAALVPHYRGHIFRQMALIGCSFLALSLACLYMLDAWQLLASLGLVVAVSTAFIALCLQRANAFNLSIIIYLGSTVSVDLAAYLPTLVLVVINLSY